MILGSVLMQYTYPMVELAAEADLENPGSYLLVFQLGYLLYVAVMPVAGFLLVEGLTHTSNRGKLIARLALAAVAAQLIITASDYITGMKHFPFYRVNFYFTLLISAVAILVVELKIKKYREGTLWYNLLSLMVYLLAATVALAAGADLAQTGVMIIVAVYMFRSNPLLLVLFVAALQVILGGGDIFSYAPVLGILLIFFYNGEKGIHGTWTRAFVYLAYPAAYLAMSLVLRFI